mgnify:CR=1 FL=1
MQTRPGRPNQEGIIPVTSHCPSSPSSLLDGPRHASQSRDPLLHRPPGHLRGGGGEDACLAAGHLGPGAPLRAHRRQRVVLVHHLAAVRPAGIPLVDQLAGPNSPITTAPVVGQRAVDVSGTFNATAAAGLGVGANVLERSAKAGEETARNTREMLSEIRNGGIYP